MRNFILNPFAASSSWEEIKLIIRCETMKVMESLIVQCCDWCWESHLCLFRFLSGKLSQMQRQSERIPFTIIGTAVRGLLIIFRERESRYKRVSFTHQDEGHKDVLVDPSPCCFSHLKAEDTNFLCFEVEQTEKISTHRRLRTKCASAWFNELWSGLETC